MPDPRTPSTPRPAPRPQRRGPARASRFVVGGIAASSGIAMVGLMGQAAKEPPPAPQEFITKVVVVEIPVPLPQLPSQTLVSSQTAKIDRAVVVAPAPPQPPPTTTTTTTTVVSKGS